MKHQLSQKVKSNLKNCEERKNREGYSVLLNSLFAFFFFLSSDPQSQENILEKKGIKDDKMYGAASTQAVTEQAAALQPGKRRCLREV